VLWNVTIVFYPAGVAQRGSSEQTSILAAEHHGTKKISVKVSRCVHAGGCPAASPLGAISIKAMLTACQYPLIFVSAFPDFAGFRQHFKEIAWETGVWIAEMPDQR